MTYAFYTQRICYNGSITSVFKIKWNVFMTNQHYSVVSDYSKHTYSIKHVSNNLYIRQPSYKTKVHKIKGLQNKCKDSLNFLQIICSMKIIIFLLFENNMRQ